MDVEGLSEAAFLGETSKMKLILERGAQANAKDSCGFTALHKACVAGQLQAAQVLLANKANVNERDLVRSVMNITGHRRRCDATRVVAHASVLQ